MEVSIHVGVIVVRAQYFVLIYEFIPISPNNYIYINYNYPHIYLLYISVLREFSVFMLSEEAIYSL